MRSGRCPSGSLGERDALVVVPPMSSVCRDSCCRYRGGSAVGELGLVTPNEVLGSALVVGDCLRMQQANRDRCDAGLLHRADRLDEGALRVAASDPCSSRNVILPASPASERPSQTANDAQRRHTVRRRPRCRQTSRRGRCSARARVRRRRRSSDARQSLSHVQSFGVG
jgi:hypothetical protein